DPTYVGMVQYGRSEETLRAWEEFPTRGVSELRLGGSGNTILWRFTDGCSGPLSASIKGPPSSILHTLFSSYPSLVSYLHLGVSVPIVPTLRDFHSFYSESSSREEIHWPILLSFYPKKQLYTAL